MATETGAVTGTTALERQRRRIDPIELLGRFAPIIFLVILAVIFSSQEPAFASERNFWFLLRQTFVYGIVAVGMTFVIITGGIDLSVGSVLAFAGVVMASTLHARLPVPAALAVALATGLFCGVVNGALITVGRLPPFIATLGMMSVARGTALMFPEGRPVSAFSGSFRALATGEVF